MGYSLGKEFILLTPKCNEDMIFDPLLVNYFLENMEVLGSLTNKIKLLFLTLLIVC